MYCKLKPSNLSTIQQKMIPFCDINQQNACYGVFSIDISYVFVNSYKISAKVWMNTHKKGYFFIIWLKKDSVSIVFLSLI
jgi:hypothetical protein